MSRCFPFPPPGYEKKAITDDTDTLAKERHKEKKHKKDKKDKEKREGKEKKDKDGTKEKHREKKDRKEKHKDKKNRDRDKEKDKISDDNRIERQLGSSNGEKLGQSSWQIAEAKDSKAVQELGWRIKDEDRAGNQKVQKVTYTDPRRADFSGSMAEGINGYRANGKEKCKDNNGIEGGPECSIGEKFGQTSRQNVETKNSKSVQELDRRSKGEVRGGNQMVEKVTSMGSRRADFPGSMADSINGYKAKGKEKNKDCNRIGGQPECLAGDKFGQNSRQSAGAKDSRSLQELGWRIKDEDGARNQILQKITFSDPRRAEYPGSVAVNGNMAKGKEKIKDKREGVTKTNEQSNTVEASGLGNAIVQKFSEEGRPKVEGMARPMEKDNVEKRVEGKERNKHKESNSKRSKHRDGDQEKKSKSKVKKRDKGKEKEEKAKEKRVKNKEHSKLTEGSKDFIDAQNIKLPHLPKESSNSFPGKDFIDAPNIKVPCLPKESSNSFTSEGNLGKRKELEITGFSHENEVRPNKLLRPVSISNPIVENGRKLEPSQPSVQFASESQVAPNNHEVDTKEHKIKINGLIQAKFPNVSPVRARENGEASKKPPHPDSKYLSQILSVPKMDEWSDFDDQGWLFDTTNLQTKKHLVDSLGNEGIPQVWAEAIRIETADISALPYVIPY